MAIMAFDLIQQKLRLTAWKQNDHKERNCLKRLFDKTAKVDREQFFNCIADDAETGMLQNDLRAAYHAINVFGGRTQAQHSRIPINDASGAPCNSEEEISRRGTGPPLPGSATPVVCHGGRGDYVYVIKLKIYKYNNYNTPPKPLFYTLGPA